MAMRLVVDPASFPWKREDRLAHEDPCLFWSQKCLEHFPAKPQASKLCVIEKSLSVPQRTLKC